MTANQLCRQWADRVGALKVSHYQAATRFEWRHLFWGGTLIFFSALAAALTQLREAYSGQVPHWTAIQAAIGLIATVLAGIQTFIRWSERAEKHRNAGATYAKLELRLEQHLSLAQKTMEEELGDFYDEWARLTGGSPVIPREIYERNCACLDRNPCSHKSTAAPPENAPLDEKAQLPHSPGMSLIKHPFVLEKGRMATLTLPHDLSQSEAERLKALLSVLVSKG